MRTHGSKAQQAAGISISTSLSTHNDNESTFSLSSKFTFYSLDFRAYSPWLYQNRDLKTIHTLPVDQMTGLFLQLCFFLVLIVAFIAALRDTFQAFDEGMSCTITIGKIGKQLIDGSVLTRWRWDNIPPRNHQFPTHFRRKPNSYSTRWDHEGA